MSPSDIQEITSLVKKHFGFLFEDAQVVFAEYHSQHFGNFAIVLETAGLRVRFFKDRGTVAVHIGPLWASAGWTGEPWYDLVIVIAFLTQKQVLISEYREKLWLEDEKQLEQLAKAFLFYHDQIMGLFGTDAFSGKKEALDLMSRDIVSLLFESRRRPELQKLLEQSQEFWRQVNSV